jgi:hypothetical protein
MIITLRDPKLFIPQITATAVPVYESPETITLEQHRGFKYTSTVSAVSHNDYLITAINDDGLMISYESPVGSVDQSEFPLLKRAPGFTSTASLRFKNNRGEGTEVRLGFYNTGGITNESQPTGIVPGTYAEYSWNRVKAVFQTLPNGKMFSGQPYQDRIRADVIPHEWVSAHVWLGWGDQYLTVGPDIGRRFWPITKRHLVGSAHYGGSNYQVGDKLWWKDKDNILHSRIIIHRRTTPYPFDNVADSHYTPVDICFFILDFDLPPSITPFPMVGEWFYQYQPGSTNDNFTHCPQGFGIILWNNDAEMSPCEVPHVNDAIENASTQELDYLFGVPMHPIFTNNLAYANPITLTGYENWTWASGGKFYHNVRGGDSSSPIVFPVKDGRWAMGIQVSGNYWRPELINQLIPHIDAEAGINTGYQVEISANPML